MQELEGFEVLSSVVWGVLRCEGSSPLSNGRVESPRSPTDGTWCSSTRRSSSMSKWRCPARRTLVDSMPQVSPLHSPHQVRLRRRQSCPVPTPTACPSRSKPTAARHRRPSTHAPSFVHLLLDQRSIPPIRFSSRPHTLPVKASRDTPPLHSFPTRDCSVASWL